MFLRYQQVGRVIDIVKPVSIVEIGTWNGDHAVIMATHALQHRPKVHYRGFDLFEEANAESDTSEFNVRSHHSIEAVSAKLAAFSANNPGFSFELVRGDTRHTLPHIAADFAYIDGGHSIETIESDYERLKDCGTIIFDDYYDYDQMGRRPDIETVGCNRLLAGIAHMLLPAFDSLPSGGRVQMALAGKVAQEMWTCPRPAGQPDRRKRAVVTTFAMNGYYDYGKRFIDTFARFWPDDIPLHVYVEGPLGAMPAENIKAVNLFVACPELTDFKARHVANPKANGISDDGRDDYRFNAVKFCHKVFALTHAALTVDADILYWIDADSVSFECVTPEFLDSLLPDGIYTSYLGRSGTHSECGFMAFDLRHARNRDFMEFWRQIYDEDLVFQLPEWHDSYVYDVVRKFKEDKGEIVSYDLRAEEHDDHHPFINSPLGTHIDHLIGPRRKASGSSFALDLRKTNAAFYWNLVPWVAEELVPLAKKMAVDAKAPSDRTIPGL